MGIFHYSVGHISRSTGRSAVQNAAYITGEKIVEERRGITADYRNKKGSVEIISETLAPEGAPQWAKNLQSVWNKMEIFEDSYAEQRYRTPETKEAYLNSSRTALTVIVALQKELTLSQNQEVLRDFIRDAFVSKGLISTYGIHNEDGNPHAHILVSRRSLTPEGGISWRKNREINSIGGLRQQREAWATFNNHALEKAGFEVRIDSRSFAERGIDLVPTHHEGWYAHQLVETQQESELISNNEEIKIENKERVSLVPDLVIKELLSKQSTFTEVHLLRTLQKRVQDDPALSAHVLEQILKESVVVGIDLEGQKRYTSVSYQAQEKQLFGDIDFLAKRQAFLSVPSSSVEQLLVSSEYGHLNAEQRIAVQTLCVDRSLGVMVGRSGTGKTTTLKPVLELHQQAGYEVIGMALAASAAENLGKDTGCASETIAFYLDKWERYHQIKEKLPSIRDPKETNILLRTLTSLQQYQLKPTHLVVVDEAAMVGTRQWQAVAEAVKTAGAKLLAVGDDHQFKAIEAGDAFRKLKDHAEHQNRLCELSAVVRQKKDWMKGATLDLAVLNTSTALALYENKGHVTGTATAQDSRELIAETYVRRLLDTPEKTGLVLTYTREECAQLNQAIRASLKEKNLLSKEPEVLIDQKGFTVGDRIVFLKNDRYQKAVHICPEKGTPVSQTLLSETSVKNGTYGVIEKIDSTLTKEIEGILVNTHRVTVRVQQHRVSFLVCEYYSIDHGYAVTEHKSQGQTVDWALIAASQHMDAYAAYVAMTRHREDVHLYYSQEDFATFADLQRSFSKLGYKDLAIDYSIREENREAWITVQDYKSLGREMAVFLKDQSLQTKPTEEEWKSFTDLKQERTELASLMLEDWDTHRDFVRQAGLTKEVIEIAAGVKQRALSLAEQKAQLTVEHYGTVALVCRDTWLLIRTTHPGSRAKLHPEYGAYALLKEERGSLANVILEAPSLHRPFVKGVSQELGYGFATIQKQAEDYQAQALLKQRVESLPKEQQRRLETLQAYLQERNLTAQTWKDIQELKKEYESSVVPPHPDSLLSVYETHQRKRDRLAFTLTNYLEDYTELAQMSGIALPFEKLLTQSDQHVRQELISQYRHSDSVLAKGLAASELWHAWQEEKALGNKQITYAAMKKAGIDIKGLRRERLTFERYLISTELKTEEEKVLLSKLEAYEGGQDTAKQHYKLCAEEAQEKEVPVWQSSYYEILKDLTSQRDQAAYELQKTASFSTVSSLATRLEIDLRKVDEQAHAFEMRSFCERFKSSTSLLEKSLLAQELADWQSLEGENQKRAALRAVIESGISWKDLKEYKNLYELLAYRMELSISERGAFDQVKTYASLRRESGVLFAQVLEEREESRKTGTEIPIWKTSSYPLYQEKQKERDEAAFLIQKNIPQHQPYFKRFRVQEETLDRQAHQHDLSQFVGLFQSEDRREKFFAAYELQDWLAFDQEVQSKDTLKALLSQGISPSSVHQELGDLERKKALQTDILKETETPGWGSRERRDQGDQSPSYKASPSLSFEEAKTLLTDRIPDLATELLGEPFSKSGTQWRYGRKGSLVVFVSGPKKGLVSDFEQGRHGSPFFLLERELNLKGKEALEWAADWSGRPSVSAYQSREEAQNLSQDSVQASVWKPLFPVPSDILEPDVLNNRFLSYMLKGKVERTETAWFAYKDEAGQLLGYVVRLEDAEGNKITPTLTYCENEKGHAYWKWQGFGEKRALYGLDRLAQNPDKPVLIVEGEKTAEAAQNHFPDYAVVTWSGGSGAVQKTDWSVLKEREVTIWPDADEAGFKAADKLSEILKKQGVQEVRTVELPLDIPAKWDLADALPPEWMPHDLRALLEGGLRSENRGEGTEESPRLKTANPESLQQAHSLHDFKSLYESTAHIQGLTPEERTHKNACKKQLQDMALTLYPEEELRKQAESMGLDKALKGHFYEGKREQRALELRQGKGLSIDTGYGGMSL